MGSSTLRILAQTLAFMFLLMPGSGFLVIPKGEKCGGSLEGECESGLICLPDESIKDNYLVEGLCVWDPKCNCSEFQCPPRRRGDCRYGAATDPCGCCYHCARQERQICGGPSWRYGYCDKRLTCTLVIGMDSARAPMMGVCKVVPDHIGRSFSPVPCPIQTGCNVHVGICDCYSEQTCHAAFSYSTSDRCNQVQLEYLMYDVTQDQSSSTDISVCNEWTCEVQGCQCVCQYRTCDYMTTPLSETACCNILRESGCHNVSCPEIPVPSCPKDSFLSEPFFEPGQCCLSVPAMCTCNYQTCPKKHTICHKGGLPKLIVKGNGHPGTCCDQYECVTEAN